MPRIVPTLEDALASITDGCQLAVPRENSGVAMAATRALIRRGVKRLELIALPTSSLQADLLIGAGCVASIETSAVSLGEFGPAPRFTAAVIAGTIKMKDATCPALHAAFQAAEKGVPFLPLRGLIGSDVLVQIFDDAGDWVYCNETAAEFLGQAREWFPGRNVFAEMPNVLRDWRQVIFTVASTRETFIDRSRRGLLNVPHAVDQSDSWSVLAFPITLHDGRHGVVLTARVLGKPAVPLVHPA